MDRLKYKVVFYEELKPVYYFYELETNTDLVFVCTNIEENKGHFVSKEQLLQCTGLKDKNGTLIYDGDILELESFKDDNVVHICFWSNENGQWLFEPIIKGNRNAPLLGLEEFAQDAEYMFDGEIPEIIGNIHTHKELLDVKSN